ncbi:MAG: cytochrome C oxidase subunit I [Limnobacter sp.]|nr:cytochrome C oxidase subunit I [Limnobacter sp.]
MNEADLAKQRSARRTIVFVFLACAIPFILAMLALRYEWFEQTNNYGTLIEPQVEVPDQPFTNINGEPFSMSQLNGKWVLIQAISSDCDEVCQNALYFQRQARKTKGKEMYRIERVAFVTDDGPLNTLLLRQFPDVHFVRANESKLKEWLPLKQGILGTKSSAEIKGLHSHIFVVDPLGHVMMRFPPNDQLEFQKFRKDVSRLLWASNIG